MAKKATTGSKKVTTTKKTSTSGKSTPARSTTANASSKKTVKKPAVKPAVKKSAGKTTRVASTSSVKDKTPRTTAAAGKTTTASKASAGKAPRNVSTKAAAGKPAASRPAAAAPVKTAQPTRTVKKTKAASAENKFKVNFSGSSDIQEREPLTEDQLRKIKSGLSKKDMAAFTQLLLDKRAQLSGDVESLRNDAKNASANISYEHMADTGSDNYEQEFTLGLVETERQLLNEIDDALHRIEKGYYGVCVETGQPIGRPRLEAKPWARYCIEVAREKERRAAPRFRA